jgi:hypothetical protein
VVVPLRGVRRMHFPVWLEASHRCDCVRLWRQRAARLALGFKHGFWRESGQNVLRLRWPVILQPPAFPVERQGERFDNGIDVGDQLQLRRRAR